MSGSGVDCGDARRDVERRDVLNSPPELVPGADD
jgi:hypothetical protein